MITITCDKCGKTITGDPLSQLQYPSYRITRYSVIYPLGVSLDLCRDCTKELDDWLDTREINYQSTFGLHFGRRAEGDNNE